MRVTLSAAATADGYLDDNGPGRLMISTPEDWAAVLRLRGQCDAILVGAETLRRDNPALLLRDEAVRERRRAAGLRPRHRQGRGDTLRKTRPGAALLQRRRRRQICIL